MKIESNDRTVDELLRMGYFRIPRFQRPYSWEREELEDFWNDTIESVDKDYFIGSIVLFRYNEDVNGLVDGQQRLTTITMLLCAMRNILNAQGCTDLAKGLHRLIERPNIDNKNEFVLQTESSYPYLQEHIQKFDGSLRPVTTTDEETRLKNAFEIISANLASVVDPVLKARSISNEKRRDAIKSALIKIRDRVLRLKLIVVVLQDEEDAYMIFETMNTRGKDLTVSDLVRTHITRLLPQSNRLVDRPKERFNEIIGQFEASEADISINSFLHHYWLSRYEYTTERKLYKAIKKRIRSPTDTKTYLDSLESNAAHYRTIHEPKSARWGIEQLPVRDSLVALNLFRVRQQIPFVLSVLGEYENGCITLRQAKRALQAVENFHFAFTAVTSQRSSGGISFMYALHARELRAAKPSNKDKVINGLIAKLKARRPSYQEFEANFRGILCSEKYTKRKALVQYILGRMTNKSLPSVPIDWERMTIEHIAGQGSRSGTTSLSDKDVAEIGNLLLVGEPLNSKLKNKAFADKMAILKQHRVYLDDYLKKQTTWGARQIHGRSNHLAKTAYKTVWRL